MSNAQIEKRLAALENEVARLKAERSAALPWWERMYGIFAGKPMFDEAVRLGREYRESLRPAPPKRRDRKRGRGGNADAARHGSR